MKTWFKYMKKYRLYAILCPIFMVLEVIADITIPYLMAKIVDVGIKNLDNDYIIKTSLFMIFVAFLGIVFGIISSHLGATAGYGLGAEMRRGLFEKIQNLSFSSINKFSVASLVTRLTNDINTLSQVTMMSLRVAIRAPFMMIFALIMAFNINNRLATIFLVNIPFMLIISYIVVKKAKPLFKKAQQKIDKLNLIIQENLIGIKVVKSFNREKSEREKFGKANEEFQQTIFSAIRLALSLFPIFNLIVYVSIVAVLWLGSFEITAGSMGKGELISFITYNTQVLMSLIMLAMYFAQVMRAITSLGRVNEVLSEEDDITIEDDMIDTIKNGEIIFDNVSFAYAPTTNYLLENINLEIKSGETIGIIGSTGSGKSTLVQLIPRLYELCEGKIKVGGVDIKSYHPKALRKNISYVPQKNILFSGTIRENIRFEDKTITDEDIIKALKMAQAWDFLKKNEHPLDTIVEQGGKNFSGGQKQRLCIARAFVKKSKILILDDATSAIDTDTEQRIQKSFKEIYPNTTKLIISQKISSIENADKIIVMNEGKIEDIGTNDYLIKNNKNYNEIYTSQMKAVM